jgi:hypothetical protein
MGSEGTMTREQLEHAIRAACEVCKDSEIWIFGSQAIFGEFPNAPEALRASIEVDVQPKNRPDKLVAYREKDRDFVRVLLTEGMINAQIILERICSLMIDDPLRERLVQWAQNTAEEL